jgi:hypothetical protein
MSRRRLGRLTSLAAVAAAVAVVFGSSGASGSGGSKVIVPRGQPVQFAFTGRHDAGPDLC